MSTHWILFLEFGFFIFSKFKLICVKLIWFLEIFSSNVVLIKISEVKLENLKKLSIGNFSQTFIENFYKICSAKSLIFGQSFPAPILYPITMLRFVKDVTSFKKKYPKGQFYWSLKIRINLTYKMTPKNRPHFRILTYNSKQTVQRAKIIQLKNIPYTIS